MEETPYEALASICSVLVVGLFILTFLAQNFVIPSGSMENTLLVGDHLVVDRITLAPPAKWMPLVHYREPRRGDVVVFIKPVPNDAEASRYLFLVKRLSAFPATIFICATASSTSMAWPRPSPMRSPRRRTTTVSSWTISRPFRHDVRTWAPPKPGPSTIPNHVKDGDLVVPPGKYFMMGDNRHNSLDSRYWGFVPRANIVGRPLFNYWSFKTPEDQYEQTGVGNRLAWMGHVALHFFTDTRWNRTLHVIR